MLSSDIDALFSIFGHALFLSTCAFMLGCFLPFAEIDHILFFGLGAFSLYALALLIGRPIWDYVICSWD